MKQECVIGLLGPLGLGIPSTPCDRLMHGPSAYAAETEWYAVSSSVESAGFRETTLWSQLVEWAKTPQSVGLNLGCGWITDLILRHQLSRRDAFARHQ